MLSDRLHRYRDHLDQGRCGCFVSRHVCRIRISERWSKRYVCARDALGIILSLLFIKC